MPPSNSRRSHARGPNEFLQVSLPPAPNDRFTGERFVPAYEDGVIELEHFHRYLLALPYARGRAVLDIASGEGYGSDLLAQVAESVVGIDKDAETIRISAERYRRTNLIYRVGECVSMPVETGTFDLVISFETLEHIEDHDTFATEIKRALKKTGTLLISTPDRAFYNAGPTGNPFHKRELSENAFSHFLKRHFEYVEVAKQCVLYGSVVSPILQKTGNGPATPIMFGKLDTIDMTATLTAGPVDFPYLIAIASDRPLSALSGSIYEGRYPRNTIPSIIGGIAERDSALLEARTAAGRLQEQVNSQVTVLHAELAEARRQRDQYLELLERDRRLDEICFRVTECDKIFSALRAFFTDEFSATKTALHQLGDRIKAGDKSHDELCASLELKHDFALALRSQYDRLQEEAAITRTELGRLDLQGATALNLLKADLLASVTAMNEMRTAAESERSVIKEALRRLEAENAHFRRQEIKTREELQQAHHISSTTSITIDRLNNELRTLANVSHAVRLQLERKVSKRWRLPSRFALRSPRALLASLPTGAKRLIRTRLPSAVATHLRRYSTYSRLRASGLFDPDHYLQTYPDVRRSKVNPLWHFVVHGANEGRDPNPIFGTANYLIANPDVKARRINPLLHYILHGRGEGRALRPSTTLLTPNQRPDPYSIRPDDIVLVEAARGTSYFAEYGGLETAENLNQAGTALATRIPRAIAEKASTPDVSIIIPVYSQLAYTLNCLDALCAHSSRYSVEIIVVDDGSPDASGDVLHEIPWIRVVTPAKNGGFIKACNLGASVAEGRFVVLLNNDTRVVEDWLNELIGAFEILPTAGLVGSKLFYPDGRLQEAGGILWQDGSAWNYGRNDDPGRPEYTYARSVDYCSGASIAVRRSLWAEVGGLDEQFCPAYCEDSDIALRIRARGFGVFLAPYSRVVHYEGKTSGRDLETGVKSFQIRNTTTLYRRWQNALSEHRPNGTCPELEKDRGITKRILVIDAVTPTPDQDSGSVTALNFMKTYQALGYKVSFVPESNFLYDPLYSRQLQRLGIECHYLPFDSGLEDLLARKGAEYDLIQFFRFSTAAPHLNLARRYAPQAAIIFHNSDMHHVRVERQAQLLNDNSLREQARSVKKQEFGVINSVDCTVVHTEVEAAIVRDETPEAPVVVFPYVLDLFGTRAPFDSRRDIMFLGGFRHTPNVDAVSWFAGDIFPLIKQQIGPLKFFVVGANPTDEVLKLASEEVIVTGKLTDLRPIFDSCRVFVAPLRYGAGQKGKVSMAMSFGLPAVLTSIAAEGMELIHGKHGLIADDPAEFASQVIRLYLDSALWKATSCAQQEFVELNYNQTLAKQTVQNIVHQAHLHRRKVR